MNICGGITAKLAKARVFLMKVTTRIVSRQCMKGNFVIYALITIKHFVVNCILIPNLYLYQNYTDASVHNC